MSDQSSVGELLDSLGVTLDLREGDMVADVVVIAKIVDSDGEPTVGIGSSEALTGLDQFALICAAREITRRGFEPREDD